MLRTFLFILIMFLPLSSGAATLKISGEFIFDAGIYPETYGTGAGVTTGVFEFFYNPTYATETSYTDTGILQTSNYDGGILFAYIDFAGVRYVTSAEDSLRNTIAVWDEYNPPYPNNRDRVNFLIGSGSEEAGYPGVYGDDIVYNGVTYSPQNSVSVSPLRTSMALLLSAADYDALTSTEIPSVDLIEALFPAENARIAVNSLYGTDGTFWNLGGDVTSFSIDRLPGCEESGGRPQKCRPPEIIPNPLPAGLPLLVGGLAVLGVMRLRRKACYQSP